MFSCKFWSSQLHLFNTCDVLTLFHINADNQMTIMSDKKNIEMKEKRVWEEKRLRLEINFRISLSMISLFFIFMRS
uniref:Ovule protein n=1 Tax=Caenorhabditis tropicalis TaxID=1561998 RepID=A0A1I7T394_9PELO